MSERALRDAAIRHEALAKLGIARQHRLSEEEFDVYLDELDKFAAGIVREACRQIACEPREAFETAFPSLGTLISRCAAVIRQEDAKRRDALADEGMKYLRASETHNAPEMTREEAKAFVNRLKAEVDAKRKRIAS